MIRDGFLSHIRRLNEEDSRLSDEGVGRIWPKGYSKHKRKQQLNNKISCLIKIKTASK